MPESPPISPRTFRRGKRSRRGSRGGFSIEELSPDDMGYDGDIEVLHPNQYEEPESEFEDDEGLRRLWPDTDEELATKMTRLRWFPKAGGSPRSTDKDKSLKRRSNEMDMNDQTSPRKHTDIEVLELVDVPCEGRPAKRRRKRDEKPNIPQRLMKDWTDTSDKTEGKETPRAESSSSASASEAPGNEDKEDMDVD